MMNAREMFARYAQGGMVDEVGQLRAAEGGSVSREQVLAKYAANPLAERNPSEEAIQYWMGQSPQALADFDKTVASVRAQNPEIANRIDQERRAAVLQAYAANPYSELRPSEQSIQYWMNQPQQELAKFNQTVSAIRQQDPALALKIDQDRANARAAVLQAYANNPLAELNPSEESIQYWMRNGLEGFEGSVLAARAKDPALAARIDAERLQDKIVTMPTTPPAITPGVEGFKPDTAGTGAITGTNVVTAPKPDTTFQATAPRNLTYDTFGRVSGIQYTPSTKLTNATGTTAFNWTPPAVTMRQKTLLDVSQMPGAQVDPVTGRVGLGLSASQQFARDRSLLGQQARQMYAQMAASDPSLPKQMPYGATQAFQQAAMSDPKVVAQLRGMDIPTSVVDKSKETPGAAANYGPTQMAAALQQAFDPFLARIKPQLQQMQQQSKSYFERYPWVAEEYAKLSEADRQKYPSPDAYAAWHFNVHGQKAGLTAPNVFNSPYAAFFSKGGEASTEDFLKKQSGGDVPRGTASPETRGVSSLKGYGEGEGAADIRRSAREALRGLVGLEPFDPTNPSEAYRIASTPTPLTMLGAGMAKAIPASKRLLMMPCCDMKGEVPAAAKQLYKGVFYQTYNKQARPGAEPNMVILSAKHGFVEPTKEIAPYNQKMTTKQADELSTNIRSSLDQVQWPTGIEEVMLVGGKEYQKVMRAAIKELQDQGKVSPDVIINATKGEIGEQRSQLGKYLREIPGQEPLEKQDGGEATVEEFIKKNVSRGTSEVPQLDAEGRLIDENAEMRSESQRMLNRLKTAQQENYRRGKLPPGVQRAVTDVMSEDKPPLVRGKAIQTAGDIVGGLVSATPREPTNPSEVYKIAQLAGIGVPNLTVTPVGNVTRAARMAAQEPRATMSAARRSLEELGDIPTALAQPNQLGAQAGIARVPGGFFPTSRVPGKPLSDLDKGFEGVLKKIEAGPDDEKKQALMTLFNQKAKDFYTKQASSIDDPLRQDILSGRLRFEEGTPMADLFPNQLQKGAAKGDLQSLRMLEQNYDRMIGLKATIPYRQGINPATRIIETQIMQHIKDNLDQIPDAQLLAYAGRKPPPGPVGVAQAAAKVRQSLKDNPGLFETYLEPRIAKTLFPRYRELSDVYMVKYPALSPNVVNELRSPGSVKPDPVDATTDLKGYFLPEVEQAIEKNQPIYDVDPIFSPSLLGMKPDELLKEARKLSQRELEKTSFPQFVKKAFASSQEADERKKLLEQVPKLIKEGKAPSEKIMLFGTKTFLPTSDGFKWIKVTDPDAVTAIAQGMNNSVGSYATSTTYGSLGKGRAALERGEAEIYSLYDKNNVPHMTVEYLTNKAVLPQDTPSENVKNTIAQFTGNGPLTRNEEPGKQYIPHIKALVDRLNPSDVPFTISQLLKDNK